MNIFSNTKNLYFPKILNREVIDSGIDFEFVFFDAHISIYHTDIFDDAKSMFKEVVIDPCSHFLQYSRQRNKKSFQRLPYSHIEEISKIHGDPTYRLQELVMPVVGYQIDSGATAIIAPYLCSKDLHSSAFNTNLTMISETRIHLNSRESDLPLFAPICLGSEALSINSAVNAVADFYTDNNIAKSVDAYYLMLAGLDDRNASTDELLGAARLVYELSLTKPVLVKHIGGFGLVLSAIANNRFMSYPASGETFNLDLLDSDRKAYGRVHSESKYITEVFNYVNNIELSKKRLDYKCSCPACSGDFEKSSISKQRKIHYLHQRVRESSELMGIPRRNKIELLIHRISDGIEFGNQAQAKGYSVDINHLYKWREVLEKAVSWNFIEDDEELQKFLEVLEDD